MTEPNFNKQDGVSLKEHFDDRLKSLEHTMCLKITALADKTESTRQFNQLAILKAEDSINERLAGMNEFRAQMKDQTNTFVTATLFKNTQENTDSRINKLEKIAYIAEGKASQTSMLIALVGSVIGIILGLMNLLGG